MPAMAQQPQGPRGLPLALLLLPLILGLWGCGPDTSKDSQSASSLRRSTVPDSMTIPRMLETDDRFSTLRAALDSTALDTLLVGGPYTLFAPPNDAFGALPPGTMDALLTEEPDRLRAILRHHIVEGRLWTDDWSRSQTVISLSGDTLSLHRTQDGLSVGEVSVVDGDIEAANGLLHVIDEVLPPPSQGSPP